MADSRLIAHLERWVAALCAGGLARTGDVRRVEYGARVRVNFEFDSGASFHAEITDHELRMGEGQDLHRWMRVIEKDLTRRHERQRAAANPPMFVTSNPQTIDSTFLRMYRAELGRVWQAIFDEDMFVALTGCAAPPDPAADKRAKDLFRLVAGAEAFDTLNANRPLPITGSTGTRYTLHRRSTFCVERVEDGAKLCAVVPGVPLWDHLLGIKLMVEHDEPKFLETANVVLGPRAEAERHDALRAYGRSHTEDMRREWREIALRYAR